MLNKLVRYFIYSLYIIINLFIYYKLNEVVMGFNSYVEKSVIFLLLIAVVPMVEFFLIKSVDSNYKIKKVLCLIVALLIIATSVVSHILLKDELPYNKCSQVYSCVCDINEKCKCKYCEVFNRNYCIEEKFIECDFSN